MSNSNDKVRRLIVWEVPSLGSSLFIEMYLNPTQIQITEAKIINPVRTKGGYVVQYWGEELTKVQISGSTGSGGIEAINVIRDVYRSEQLALQKIIQSRGNSSKRRQSLAQLASSVIMWHEGRGLRGYFTSFSNTESASDLGIFNYTLDFTAVEAIGVRTNFLPWHRKPWSTMDSPSSDDGKGSTTGGAYGTNFKMGELNAPVIDSQSGILRDPEFTSRTGLTITPGSPEAKDLQDNLAENSIPLSPSNLFS